MVNVCCPPPVSIRRSLIWLPRCDTTLNPKIDKILTTSAPERTLSLGMRQRLKFKAGQDGRIVNQVKVREVFTFQLESNRLPQILRQFIQRLSLSNDGQVEALGDEMILASENVDLDNFLHLAPW
jgi:hypothetical protein